MKQRYEVYLNNRLIGTKIPSEEDTAYREIQGTLAGKGLDGFHISQEGKRININVEDPHRIPAMESALKSFLS
jgi:hypothetical protein